MYLYERVRFTKRRECLRKDAADDSETTEIAAVKSVEEKCCVMNFLGFNQNWQKKIHENPKLYKVYCILRLKIAAFVTYVLEKCMFPDKKPCNRNTRSYRKVAICEDFHCRPKKGCKIRRRLKSMFYEIDRKITAAVS